MLAAEAADMVDGLIHAIDQENQQSEDLPNTSNPDEWTRIIGRQGKRVAEVEVV